MVARRTFCEWAPREHGDPLADEVVVDFPSTADLAERMRASFFGFEDGDAVPSRLLHRAEVRLTPREADKGTKVPVDLPVRLTCPVCGGRGEVWNEVCGICIGSGGEFLSHQLDVRVPPGVQDGTRLRFSLGAHFAPNTHVEVRIAIP